MFDVGILSLTAPVPAAPVLYGSSVQLGGLVRGVTGVSIEQRPSSAAWTPLGTVTPLSDGTIQLTETPTITTDYRLATTTAAAAYVRIKVMPVVTLSQPYSGGTSLAGTIAPALPGAPAQTQQLGPDGVTWTTVATGAVDPTSTSVGQFGSFTVPLTLSAGTYRAVITPGHGYSPGTSAPLIVTG